MTLKLKRTLVSHYMPDIRISAGMVALTDPGTDTRETLTCVRIAQSSHQIALTLDDAILLADAIQSLAADLKNGLIDHE